MEKMKKSMEVNLMPTRSKFIFKFGPTKRLVFSNLSGESAPTLVFCVF